MFLPYLLPPIFQKTAPHVLRCEAVLASLSSELHLPVVAPKSLQECMIYLDRKGTSPLVALQTVSTALNASLVRSKDGFEIERNASDWARIRKRRTEQRTKWLENRFQAIAAFRKVSFATNGQRDPLVEAYARDARAWNDLRDGTQATFPNTTADELLPMSELLEGVAKRIGWPMLATLPSGHLSVYEDLPVRSASKLPDCQDLIERYITESEHLGNPELRKQISEEVMRADPSGTIFSGLPKEPQKMVRLRFECAPDENKMLLTLEGYDSAGQRIDRAVLAACATEGLATSSTLMKMQKGRPSAWVDLSPDAQHAVEVVAPGSTLPPPDWFFDPTQKEPLDLFVREAVAGVMSDVKDQCVAVEVTDSLWSMVAGSTDLGRVNLNALDAAMRMCIPYDKIVDRDSVIWRPLDPEIAEARQANRKVLAAFATNAAKTKRVDLRSLSLFRRNAAQEPGHMTDLWPSLARRVAAWQAGDLSERTYRFLGAIGESDWSRLAAGATHTADSLKVVPELKRLFEDEPWNKPTSADPIPDLYQHIPELYIQENLDNAPISLRSVNVPVLRVWSNTEPEPEFWSSGDVLSSRLRLPATATIWKDGEFRNTLSREGYERRLARLLFRRGARQTQRLTIGLPKAYLFTADVPGTVEPAGGAFTYDSLPKEVRDRNWEIAVREGAAEAALRRSAQNTP